MWLSEEVNFNRNGTETSTSIAEKPSRVTDSKIMQDCTDKSSYYDVGIEERQLRELNKLAPYLHAANENDEEHGP